MEKAASHIIRSIWATLQGPRRGAGNKWARLLTSSAATAAAQTMDVWAKEHGVGRAANKWYNMGNVTVDSNVRLTVAVVVAGCAITIAVNAARGAMRLLWPQGCEIIGAARGAAERTGFEVWQQTAKARRMGVSAAAGTTIAWASWRWARSSSAGARWAAKMGAVGTATALLVAAAAYATTRCKGGRKGASHPPHGQPFCTRCCNASGRGRRPRRTAARRRPRRRRTAWMMICLAAAAWMQPVGAMMRTTSTSITDMTVDHGDSVGRGTCSAGNGGVVQPGSAATATTASGFLVRTVTHNVRNLFQVMDGVLKVRRIARQMEDHGVCIAFLTGTEDSEAGGGSPQKVTRITQTGAVEDVTWLAVGGNAEEDGDDGELYEKNKYRGVSVLLRGAGKQALEMAGDEGGPCWGKVSSRILWLDVKFGSHGKTRIFACYAPHSGLGPERKRFWGQLREAAAEAQRDASVNDIWVTGDLNSRLNVAVIGDRAGKHPDHDVITKGELADAAQELTDFINAANLVSVHTDYDNPATFVGTRGGLSTIDYVFVTAGGWTKRHVNGWTWGKDTWQIDDRPDEDHKAIVIEWSIMADRKAFMEQKTAASMVQSLVVKRNQGPTTDTERDHFSELVAEEIADAGFEKLRTPTGLRDAITKATTKLAEHKADAADITKTDAECCEWSRIERKRLNDVSWEQPDSDDKWAQMNDENLLFELMGIETEAARQALKVVTRRITSRRGQQVEKFFKAKASGRGGKTHGQESRQYHAAVPHPDKNKYVKKLLTKCVCADPLADITNLNLYDDLKKSPQIKSLARMFSGKEQDAEYRDARVRHAVVEVLRKMKTGKATGVDGDGSELYKDLPAVAVELLCANVTAWIQGEIVLNDPGDRCIRESILGWVWKDKPNIKHNDLSGYRTVGVPSTTRKIYAGVYMQLLGEVYAKTISTKQGAFRSGYRSIDAAQVLVNLNEALWAADVEGAFLSVDFSKAYDTCDRDQIQNMLEAMHLPGRFCAMNGELMAATAMRETTGGKAGTAFPTDKGLVQGDVQSPAMWNLYLEMCWRGWRHDSATGDGVFAETRGIPLQSQMPNGRIINWEIREGFYADDTFFVATDGPTCVRIADSFTRACMKYGGLQASLGRKGSAKEGKTEWCRFGKVRPEPARSVRAVIGEPLDADGPDALPDDMLHVGTGDGPTQPRFMTTSQSDGDLTIENTPADPAKWTFSIRARLSRNASDDEDNSDEDADDGNTRRRANHSDDKDNSDDGEDDDDDHPRDHGDQGGWGDDDGEESKTSSSSSTTGGPSSATGSRRRRQSTSSASSASSSSASSWSSSAAWAATETTPQGPKPRKATPQIPGSARHPNVPKPKDADKLTIVGEHINYKDNVSYVGGRIGCNGGSTRLMFMAKVFASRQVLLKNLGILNKTTHVAIKISRFLSHWIPAVTAAVELWIDPPKPGRRAGVHGLKMDALEVKIMKRIHQLHGPRSIRMSDAKIRNLTIEAHAAGRHGAGNRGCRGGRRSKKQQNRAEGDILPPISTRIRRLRCNYFFHNLRECGRYDNTPKTAIPLHCLMPYAIYRRPEAGHVNRGGWNPRIDATVKDFRWLRAVEPDVITIRGGSIVIAKNVKAPGQGSTKRTWRIRTTTPKPKLPHPTKEFEHLIVLQGKEGRQSGITSITARPAHDDHHINVASEHVAVHFSPNAKKNTILYGPGGAGKVTIGLNDVHPSYGTMTGNDGKEYVAWRDGDRVSSYSPVKNAEGVTMLKPYRYGGTDVIKHDDGTMLLFDIKYLRKGKVYSIVGLHAEEIKALSFDIAPQAEVQGVRRGAFVKDRLTKAEVKRALKAKKTIKKATMTLLQHDELNVTLAGPAEIGYDGDGEAIYDDTAVTANGQAWYHRSQESIDRSAAKVETDDGEESKTAKQARMSARRPKQDIKELLKHPRKVTGATIYKYFRNYGRAQGKVMGHRIIHDGHIQFNVRFYGDIDTEPMQIEELNNWTLVLKDDDARHGNGGSSSSPTARPASSSSASPSPPPSSSSSSSSSSTAAAASTSTSTGRAAVTGPTTGEDDDEDTIECDGCGADTMCNGGSDCVTRGNTAAKATSRSRAATPNQGTTAGSLRIRLRRSTPDSAPAADRTGNAAVEAELRKRAPSTGRKGLYGNPKRTARRKADKAVGQGAPAPPHLQTDRRRAVLGSGGAGLRGPAGAAAACTGDAQGRFGTRGNGGDGGARGQGAGSDARRSRSGEIGTGGAGGTAGAAAGNAESTYNLLFQNGIIGNGGLGSARQGGDGGVRGGGGSSEVNGQGAGGEIGFGGAGEETTYDGEGGEARKRQKNGRRGHKIGQPQRRNKSAGGESAGGQEGSSSTDKGGGGGSSEGTTVTGGGDDGEALGGDRRGVSGGAKRKATPDDAVQQGRAPGVGNGGSGGTGEEGEGGSVNVGEEQGKKKRRGKKKTRNKNAQRDRRKQREREGARERERE